MLKTANKLEQELMFYKSHTYKIVFFNNAIQWNLDLSFPDN
jgi:hypothetical protein